MKNKHFTAKKKIIKTYSNRKYCKNNKNKINKTLEILQQVYEYYGPYFW